MGGAVAGKSYAEVLIERTLVDKEMARRRFEELDADGSGTLEKSEVAILVAELVKAGVTEDSLGLSATDGDLSVQILEWFDRDMNNALDFTEFCHLFEEIVTRAALQQECKRIFEEVNKEEGYMAKEDLAVMHQGIAGLFSRMGCSVLEVQTIEAKLLHEVHSSESSEDKINEHELLGIIDSICVTMRLIRNAEAKFRELDVDGNGTLEGAELEALADWLIQTCTSKYGAVPPHEAIAMKMRIMEAFDANKDGKLNLPELAVLYEAVLERRSKCLVPFLSYSCMDSLLVLGWLQMVSEYDSEQSAPQNNLALGHRRMSNFSFNDVTDQQLILQGIAPIAREKFKELDKFHTGMIDRAQVVELTDWMLRTYKMMGGDRMLSEEELVAMRDELLEGLDSDLENPLDFEEFCALYDEVYVRIDVKRVWDEQLRLLNSGGTTLTVGMIDHLTDTVLAVFSMKGYTREDCNDIKRRVTAAYENQLSEEEIVSVVSYITTYGTQCVCCVGDR